jgi:hypothetical protein
MSMSLNEKLFWFFFFGFFTGASVVWLLVLAASAHQK